MDMRKGCILLLIVALVLCSWQAPGNVEGAPSDGFIIGTVSGAAGAGVPGAKVMAVNVSGGQNFSVLSGADGSFSLTVPAGAYNVTASLANFTANVSYAGVAVGEGEEVVLDFTLKEVLCTLTGYVTNGTQPIYGATVTLLNSLYNYSAVSVNPLGQYTITDVRPGTYTVVASKAGYYDSEPLPPIEMARNVTKYVDFELEEQPAELNGRVNYQGDGVGGVKVVISNAQFTATTITDEDGNYSFDLIPAGTYSMTLTKERYLEKTVNVGIAPFEVKHLDVELEYDSENNTQEFLLGFDLAHSLMVVGLIITLIILMVALFVNYKAKRKPELLDEPEEPSEKE